MAKTYRCYKGSDVDFEFEWTYLSNRDMLRPEHYELRDHVFLDDGGTVYGYMRTTWEYYDRLKAFCLMADEHRREAYGVTLH